MSTDAPFEGAEEQFELSGPEDGGWYGSQLKDWVPVAHGLSDGAARFYWILRALIVEKHGKVRKLTMWELCCLMPTRSGKPSSRSRMRDLLKELSAPEFMLLTTPEGGRITVSSRAKAAGRAMRIRVNDYPPASYVGYRNVFAALDAIREKAAKLADKAVKEEARRETARKAERETAEAAESAGQNSVPHEETEGAGQNSVPLGQNSVPPGQNSDPHTGADLQERKPPLTPSAYSLRSDADALPNAVGQSSGGFARAGAREAAAGESDGADGGCAAPGKDPIPRQQQHRQAGPEGQPARERSPQPATVKTAPRKMPPGFDEVRAAVPVEVARPGTQLWVGLRSAIADLLTGNPNARIPARTPSQVIARMNTRWYGEQGPERSAPGYTSATDAPGDRPISSPSAWLAKAILGQDCPDPACEDGMLIGSGQPCDDCAERRAEMAAARTAREAAGRAIDADMTRHARATADYQEVADILEHGARERHEGYGLTGEHLDQAVNADLARWRENCPPLAFPQPPAPLPAPAAPAPGPARLGRGKGDCCGWDGIPCGKLAVTTTGLCLACHGHADRQAQAQAAR